MRRRAFLTGLGTLTIGCARLARAQHKPPIIGFLNGGSPEAYVPMVAAFREGLKENRYIDGENTIIEFARPKVGRIDCPNWPPIWCVGKLP